MFSQTEIIFPTHAVGAPGPAPKHAERLQVTSAGGPMLQGLHIPPRDEGAKAPATLIVGFGGNAWNGEDVAVYLHELFPNAHVVAFHYRGYRPSGGEPSAEAILADAPIVLDAARKRTKTDRAVLVGFSIGSGVAASLAGRDGVDGIVLVTPFDSLKAVAQSIYPWLPVGLVFQHEIAAAQFLDGKQTPVAVIAAEGDEIIPGERTDALRRRLDRLVFDRTIAGAGHNDLYARTAFQEALREAFAVVTK